MRGGRERLRLFLVAVPPFLPDYECEAHDVGIARKFLSVQFGEDLYGVVRILPD
jgi:hypothetical protein